MDKNSSSCPLCGGPLRIDYNISNDLGDVRSFCCANKVANYFDKNVPEYSICFIENSTGWQGEYFYAKDTEMVLEQDGVIIHRNGKMLYNLSGNFSLKSAINLWKKIDKFTSIA